MCALVDWRTTGIGDTNTTPPFRMCAAAVRISTTISAMNSQLSTNVRNGSWNT